MSRVANKPIVLPSGVEFSVKENMATVKGKKGSLSLDVPMMVKIKQEDKTLTFEYDVKEKVANMRAGTLRALLNNMIIGVSEGFQKSLELVGVGYRAQMKGAALNLTLGFSHPIEYKVPEGITIETPTQTEVVVKGCQKDLVGQVAAEIRAFRPPEPYKGKGVKYKNEVIARKEAKKK
jgi:large subunit ribosomal protein L6